MRYSKYRLFNVCMHTLLFVLFVSTIHAQISCIQEINVSLDDDCESLITHDDILSLVNSAESYTLMLTDYSGNVITDNTLRISHLGTSVIAKVTNAIGSSCWSTLNVEDKLPPTISCPDVEIECHDANAAAYTPIHSDNCTKSTLQLISESLEPLVCDLVYIKEIVRTYIATDEWGNQSIECEQKIKLLRIDLDDVVFPDSYELAIGTELTCSQVTYDANGFPDIATTGVPTLNGEPIYPNTDVYCNIGVGYEDFLVAELPCTKKYMRTWTVYEAWCSSGPMKVYAQTIEISDTEDPVVIAPSNISVPAGSGTNCEALVTVPLPVVSDDCTSDLVIDISYNGGFLRNVKSAPSIAFESGVHVVTFNVYDGCDNLTTASMTVVVGDQSPPVAVCDENTVVSLRSDGTAKAWSNTFDDGSFDNCGAIQKQLVKRISSNCTCTNPEFKDMTFLGERSGRYYYLSDTKVCGFQAIAFSQAYGGMPLTLESSGEASWLHALVSAQTTDPYFIGLEDVNNTGTFTYPGHVPPSFTSWATGEPSTAGSYVTVNNAGEWVVTDGSTDKFRFVYEASDPCGYGDEVHFCCADAGTEVMVSFRVMDSFGEYNDCMVMVEVQDKVAPVISCPSSITLDCSTTVDMNNLSIYGTATAMDVCLNNNVIESVAQTINNCGVGLITRTFTASDANSQATCDQTISLLSSSASTASTIVWPNDYDTNNGCSASLAPADLPAGFGFPDLSGAACTRLAATHSDKTFSFPGNGSQACFKILRTWTVVDDCMHGMPGYTPETYEQTIKVSDNDAPVLNTFNGVAGVCQDVTINTNDCNFGAVNLSATATDNCTQATNISSRFTVDYYSNGGGFDIIQDYTNNQVSFSGQMPLGYHTATYEYFDGCGNKGTCSHIVAVINTTPPVARCVGLTVPLQEMDLDGDGTFDVTMASINASQFDAYNASAGTQGSSHPCGYSVDYTFANGLSTMLFDCNNVGVNGMNVIVSAGNGTSSVCNVTLEIQDPDDLCNGVSNSVAIAGCPGTQPVSYVFCEDIQVNLSAVSNICNTSTVMNYTYAALNSNGTPFISGSGSGNLNLNLPDVGYGMFSFVVNFTDGCGNSNSCTTIYEAQDVGLLDRCTTTPIPINLVGGTATIDAEDYVNPGYDCLVHTFDFNINQSTFDIFCTDFPTDDFPQSIALTIFGTDNQNQMSDFCTVTIVATDTDGTCGMSQQIINGEIVSENNRPIEGAQVELLGSEMVEMTNVNGTYAFPSMEAGSSYRINPVKNDDPLNGVSTLDIIAIQRHILGDELPSPYQMIAADADNSGSISALDLIELRKLILGINENFSNNTSWRMIDSDYEFANDQDPFINEFPEQYDIYNLNTSMSVDFIGVKIGDVNHTASFNNNDDVEKRTTSDVNLQMENIELTQGEIIQLEIDIDDLASVQGTQFSMSFDSEVLDVLSLEPIREDFGVSNYHIINEKGVINVSWNKNEATIAQGSTLFSITCLANKNGSVSEAFELDSERLVSEIYKNGDVMNLEIDFLEANGEKEEVGTRLFQNKPNPWTQTTDISYFLDRDQEIELNFYDVTGQLLYQEIRSAYKGINVSQIDNAVFKSGGIIYYELVSEDAQIIEKMLLVK